MSCALVQLLWACLISPLASLSAPQNRASRSDQAPDPSGPSLALEPFYRQPYVRCLLLTTGIQAPVHRGRLPDFRAVFLGLDRRQFPPVAPNDAFPQSFTPKCECDSSSSSSAASKCQECFSVSCFSCVSSVKWIEGEGEEKKKLASESPVVRNDVLLCSQGHWMAVCALS